MSCARDSRPGWSDCATRIRRRDSYPAYTHGVLTGTIRPVEKITAGVEGHSLAEIRATLNAQCPPGFELASAPVRMTNGTTLLAATGTFTRIDGQRDIDADDMPALQATVSSRARFDDRGVQAHRPLRS